MKHKIKLLFLIFIVGMAGCIYTQNQVIQSDPTGATVTYKGQVIGVTPVKVPLEFDKTTVVWGWLVDRTPEYITIEKMGYPKKEVPITADRHYVWPWWLTGSGTTYIDLRRYSYKP